MTDPIENRILYALFALSRDTLPIDAARLGAAVGVGATRAAEALVHLERSGLVDASRARLTMLGLAKAMAAGADLGGRSIDLEAAVKKAPPRPMPIAARDSVPPPEHPASEDEQPAMQ
jgi:hypothetical protein